MTTAKTKASAKKDPAPKHSDVLEGGGVTAGARLYVRLPFYGEPPLPEPDRSECDALRDARKGDEVTFAVRRALRIEGGRYVMASTVKVQGHDEHGSNVTLEVIA